jgi:3-deoxy-7-phosphoheptulonate synthase
MLATNNLRVTETVPLPSPNSLKERFPITERAASSVTTARREIEAVLSGADSRAIVIVGPCSIHDPVAAIEYAERLRRLQLQLSDDLLIVMRAYFEKPRTTTGWKGLINDPHLDGTRDVQTGLQHARKLLLDIAELGIPTATEMLDPVVPQYTADLIAWAAIGARTTESQTHREMASGLSMPVGFKNGTDGSLSIAINAMRAAQAAHSFLGVDDNGHVAAIRTSGNPYSHVVLRGGSAGPNFERSHVQHASHQLREAGLCDRVLIDCSHANSGKDPNNQTRVAADVASQLVDERCGVLGVMIESHLVAGRQDLGASPASLLYGQSITDACIDIETTEQLLRDLASVLARRQPSPRVDAARALV